MAPCEYRHGAVLVIGDSASAYLHALTTPPLASRALHTSLRPRLPHAPMAPVASPSRTPVATHPEQGLRTVNHLRAQLPIWDDWCAEHRYPTLVHAAVRRAIEHGALWFASNTGGMHGVRLEQVDERAAQGLRMAGFAHDAGLWQWWA